MSKNLYDQLYKLQILAKAPSKKRKKMLSTSDSKLLKAITEIAFNMLRGIIKLSPIQYKKLKRYKNNLRMMAQKNIPLKKKKLIVQKGGLLPLLLGPALAALAPIAGSLVGNLISK